MSGIFNPSQWEPIATASPSAVSSVAFTGLSAYRAIRIQLHGIAPATDSVDFWLRTSTDNGSNYDAGASDYQHTGVFSNVGATGLGSNSSGDTKIIVANVLGNVATSEKLSGQILLLDFNQAQYMRAVMQISYTSATPNFNWYGRSGNRVQATARNALQFLMSSGNIAGGYISLEGSRS